jgi:hypothetical protein
LNCLLGELGTPQSIIAQLGSTTALMGVQDATDDGLNYSWSYHPDNGVNMVITDTDTQSDGDAILSPGALAKQLKPL